MDDLDHGGFHGGYSVDMMIGEDLLFDQTNGVVQRCGMGTEFHAADL